MDPRKIGKMKGPERRSWTTMGTELLSFSSWPNNGSQHLQVNPSFLISPLQSTPFNSESTKITHVLYIPFQIQAVQMSLPIPILVSVKNSQTVS